MNYTDLAEKLVKKCIKAGADAAEVYIEASRNLQVDILNSEIETIQEASSQGAGFRVFVDGKMGFSHCNDFNTKSLESTISQAVAFARLSTPDESNVLPDDKGVSEVTGLYDPGISEISLTRKIDLAVELEKLALSNPKITKSSGSSYNESESEVFLANSNGLLKSYRSGGCSAGVYVVAEKGDQKNTGGETCSRVFFSDLLSPEVIASRAVSKALELIDPVMIKTQKAQVIFDNNVARSLLGGVISAINGERVLQGASFLKDFPGKQIAVPALTIIDDGTVSKGLGSSPFDGEGVPTNKNTLIENGILKMFIYNTRAARRAGVKSTGNASRGGFSSLPGIGTHNVFINPGQYGADELVRQTERGILVRELTGYGIDPVTGNFSGGVSGLWILKGQVMHPVKGITIAGRALDILNSIDMIGNDIDINGTFISPSLRVAEMQIGGK